MVLPILFGAASAASGIMSAFGQYQSDAAQINAANNNAIAQYKAQNRAIESRNIYNINRYKLQVGQYKKQLRNNYSAADRAYQSEQLRLNELFKQQRFTGQAMQISKAEELGKVAASGQAGRSQDRLAALTSAAYGRNEAIMAEQWRSAMNQTNLRNLRTRDALKAANEASFASVSQAPFMESYGPAPVLRNAPSQLGLYTGIGSSILGGIEAGYKFDSLIG